MASATDDELTPRDIERFWAKVDRHGADECWLWLASVQAARGGYGQFRLRKRTLRAHIIAYTLTVGPVPDGKVLDHLCRVPACCNPAHLEPVTFAENILRGTAPSAVNARKTHCDQGHEYTPENTIHRSGERHRECRICNNAAQRRRRQASKEAT